MHVSPVKHSYIVCVTTKKVWLPDRQTHRRTDGQTDAGQSDPYVPLCFVGDTIKWLLYYNISEGLISQGVQKGARVAFYQSTSLTASHWNNKIKQLIRQDLIEISERRVDFSSGWGKAAMAEF